VSKQTKIIVDQLIKDLQDRPEDFRCDSFALMDNVKNVEYSISKGAFCAGVYRPFEMRLGFYQGVRFFRALEKWKACQVIKGFDK